MFQVGHGNCEPVREFERVTVTRLTALTGTGVESDPYRNVEAWITDEGKLIAYFDPQDSYQESKP